MQKCVWLQVLAIGVLTAWFGSVALADDKAQATGTWKSSFTQNGQTVEITYKLKQDGDKVTGTVKRGDAKEVDIEDGKIKDGELTFQITRERDGNKFVIKYKGKVTKESIKGTVEIDRDGQTNSRDWEAKREKE
jgi:hypothetical protein